MWVSSSTCFVTISEDEMMVLFVDVICIVSFVRLSIVKGSTKFIGEIDTVFRFGKYWRSSQAVVCVCGGQVCDGQD